MAEHGADTDPTADDPFATALALQASERWEESVLFYRRAVALVPDRVEAHFNLGLALRQLGRPDEAAQSYRRALALQPDNPAIHINLGNLAAADGRIEEAADSYRRAARADPHLPEAEYGLGGMLRLLGNRTEAAEHLARALHLRPDFAEACNALGICHYENGDRDSARLFYAEALRIRPDYVEARKNLGAILAEQGRTEAAIEEFRHAVSLAPDDADGHVHLACTLLRRGDFTQGWSEYEWRRKLPDYGVPPWPTPEWRGEPLAGRRILLYGEQGFGDVIQFARFVPLLAAAGAHVILSVRPVLVRLLSTLSGLGEIVETGRPLPPFDYHLPLLSLPHRLGLTPAAIPGNPYLRADPQATAAWRSRLEALPGRRIGLVWAANSRLDARTDRLVDRRRSLPLAAFAPLAAMPGMSLVSLQKGAATADLRSWPDERALFDPMDEVEDFADTAALIAALDLVISVDTAVVHVAGALGKPVWMLSRFDGCWRWLEGRDDSPWYPNLTLFRQTAPGAWTETLARLNAALADGAA